MKKDLSNIKKAKNLLDKNHCVAIPTETVYGLAANAYSALSEYALAASPYTVSVGIATQ